MERRKKGWIRGALAMLGTIIGAGVFALPYAFQTLGLFAGSVVYWAMAAVVIATHVFYAEVIATDGAMKGMRLPGHVTKILGKWPGALAFVSHPLNIIGACLAYLIAGGEFLAIIATAVGLRERPIFWSFAFWAGSAAIVFFGIRIVARVEAWLTSSLIALLIFSSLAFFVRSGSWNPMWANWGATFFPLGIFLFTLSAFTVVPEIVEICGRDRRYTRRAVLFGSIVAAILMWVFGLTAAQALGSLATTEPASLTIGLPRTLFWLIPAVGFFAVITSFITLTQDLTSMLRLELRFPRMIAWAVALGTPLMLFLILNRDFVGTVGFVGSIFTALNGLLISLMAFVLMKRGTIRSPRIARIAALGCAAVFCFAFLWRIFVQYNGALG